MPGAVGLPAYNVEPVRYRAGMGALRLSASQAPSDDNLHNLQTLYAKLYRSNRGRQTSRTLTSCVKWCAHPEAAFSVATPAGYISERDALIEQQLPGRSLQDCLREGCDLADVVRRTAYALVAFQQTDVIPERTHSLSDESTDVVRVVTRLTLACPYLQPELDAIAGATAPGDAPTKSRTYSD